MSDPGANFLTTIQMRYEPEHARLCRDRMLQHLRQPRTSRLLEALGGGVQVVEDDAFNVLVAMVLPMAVGDQLDKWGELVGEVRGGLTDPDYRRFVQARIKSNRSEGSVDELIAVLELLTFPSTVRYFDLFPAGYAIQFIHGEWYSDVVASRVARFMQDIKPAGISMALVEGVRGYLALDVDAVPPAAGLDDGVMARRLEP